MKSWTLNSLHSRLQFTVEVEDEGKINFLHFVNCEGADSHF